MTTERTGPLEPFVYNGQSRDQIQEDVEHLIVDSSVEEIPPDAFRHIGSLAKVEIKSGVQTIGVGAFSGCDNLIEVIIPSTVVQIEYCAFYQCEDLQKVVLSMGLTQIGHHAFAGCSTLTEIIIPSTVVEIGHCAFADWGQLPLSSRERKGHLLVSLNNATPPHHTKDLDPSERGSSTPCEKHHID